MWCKNCNRETDEEVCSVCGIKTEEDIPYELHWCDECKVPLIKAINDADRDTCSLCGGKTSYLVADLRPVFPEERLLLEILSDKPLAYINKSVWASNNRYYIDGKPIVVTAAWYKKHSAAYIREQLEKYKEHNNYRFFNENIATFIRANQGRLDYKELNELLEFIPPQSIGTSIGQFVRECELRCKSSDTLFEDISTKFGFIREFDNTYTGYQNQINIIREKLEKMKNVGELQARLSTYERALRNLSVERRELDRNQALLERDKERRETERKELSLKDENNRKIEVYKAYAQYMYTTLLSLYQEKENETRQKLEQTVNEIFKSIYNGGFSLSIDEKYNIQVIVNEFEGVNEDVETSTAQSISVIFAFIAGVIKMARQSQNPENEMLVSEPYPLVMDAPLSAFDKARIRTVCDALPNVAEQVIIFIKDTDGELAETYMGDKVGSRFEFDKKNEFETNLVTR